MSVLESVMVVPSRVWAVYHYLLTAEGQREKRETLENRISPVPLRPKDKKGRPTRGMLNQVIRETVNMGLVIEEKEDETLRLNPELPACARRRNAGREDFSETLYDLFFQSKNTSNHALGAAIAWHLTQDPYEMRGWNRLGSDLTLRNLFSEMADPEESDVESEEDYNKGKVSVNKERWMQLVYWSTFLGFAWKQSTGDDELLIPDPTVFLRNRLPAVFKEHNKKTLPFPVVISALAVVCPMLEGGAIRGKIEKTTGALQLRVLSRSSALAFLRIQQEGALEFSAQADAETWQLPELNENIPCSHVTWRGKTAEGRA